MKEKGKRKICLTSLWHEIFSASPAYEARDDTFHVARAIDALRERQPGKGFWLFEGTVGSLKKTITRLV